MCETVERLRHLTLTKYRAVYLQKRSEKLMGNKFLGSYYHMEACIGKIHVKSSCMLENLVNDSLLVYDLVTSNKGYPSNQRI